MQNECQLQSKSKKLRMIYKEKSSKILDSFDVGLSKFHSESNKKNDIEILTPSPRNQQVNVFSDAYELSNQEILPSQDRGVQQIDQNQLLEKDNIEKLVQNPQLGFSHNLENEIQNSQQIIPLENQQSNITNQQTLSRKKQTLFKTQRTFRLIKNIQTSVKPSKKSSNTLTEKNTFINLKLIAQIKVKMIYFFKKFTSSGRRLLLEQNKKVRQTINDKCDMGKFNSQTIKGKLKSIFSLTDDDLQDLYNYNDDKFMIAPSSFLNISLLIMFATFNSLFLLLLSIILIFQQPNEYEPLIDNIILAVWGLEVFVHLNTQIYKGTQLINKRSVVIHLYIRDRAVFDIIPIISTAAAPSSTYIHLVMQIITFTKLRNVFIDVNLMQKYLCMTVKNYYIVQLFNLIVKLFILGHIIASMWYLIGQLELKLLHEESTWYDSSYGADGVWWKLYLESMYWALTLMTTGSNVGTSLIQLFFTTFIMLFTTIIFGYMLNTTGTILSQLNQQDENKRIDLNIINDYMRANRISKSLQSRVNQDLEHYYMNNLKKEQEENQQVLKKISPHLNRLLKLEHCRQFLEKFSFLERKFSKETLDEICLELQEEYYTPNQWLFKENQYSDISLMYVVQGSVQLVKSISTDQKECKCIQQVKKGQVIGQINFFTGLSYHLGAKSNEFTKIVKINRDKFLEIIQKNQKDSEIYCLMRDRQSIYEEYNICESRCFFCNSSTHLPTDCHLVHVQRSEILQKAKMYDGKPQFRLQFKRKNLTTNSYFIQNDIQKQIQKYMWNLRREEKLQNKQTLKQKYDLGSQTFSSDEQSQSFWSNYSSENNDESEEEESLHIQVKNSIYFDNGKALKEIVRQQQINGKNFKKKKESFESIQLSNNNQNNIKLNNSVHSLQYIEYLNIPPNQDNRNNYQGNTLNTNNFLSTKNNWAIQEVESPSQRNQRNKNSMNQRDKDYFQVESQTLINNFLKKRQSRQEQILNDRKQTFIKQKAQNSLDTQALKQLPLQQAQQSDNRKSKLKLQFLGTKQLTTQNQTLVIPQILTDDAQEKRKIANIFEFDRMKEWVYYFPQGNYKNIIQKYHRFIKKKKLKNAMINLNFNDNK